MLVSVFELFSIGVGPSSSHTLGPMRAAKKFAELLESEGLLDQVEKLELELFGSLALTGLGHGTDKALLLGLAGYSAHDVPLDIIDEYLGSIRRTHQLPILMKKTIKFNPDRHLIFHMDRRLPYHSNGMRFHAFAKGGKKLLKEVYYSVGGGFIISYSELQAGVEEQRKMEIPFPFRTFKDLKAHCIKENKTVAEIMMLNETAWRTKSEVENYLINIWRVMQESIQNGIKNEGILPGGLQVKRRAPALYKRLMEGGDEDPLHVIDWASMVGIAVNEENAAGGRIVTAPTNGAAGVIPAALFYYKKFLPDYSEKKVIDFLLTAGSIAVLYKFGASISAAEMGCQGEIGVASSMAAAALTAVMGGSLAQVENAAEIAMEHHLGTTCDPVGGLVQIPCIERNAMGVVKAINASRLALSGNGDFRVTLDEVINSMREIGMDMSSKYKETSTGGLATNVPLNLPEC
ncbi:MAG: L-serine ammonia-lyase [Rhabdochlamydiaceae bacterium]|nr:L-serine ammonia-lyase [Candidatus Amphrikana amoebophyrae]